VIRRIAAFATVGGLGFLLQLATLECLASWAEWQPLPATAAAVELAVLHNLWWHERWTWSDRGERTLGRWPRLVRYQAVTGVATIGNVIVTLLLAKVGFCLLAANALAVGAMSAANFMMSDRWIFGAGRIVRAR